MFHYVVDEEITLKLITEEDTETLFQLIDQSREALREWLPWIDGTRNKIESLSFIKDSLRDYQAKKALNCGVFVNDQLTGMISYNSVDWTNRIAYIGYWLAPEFQKKGIMTRAVRGLIDYAFEELDLNRIDIRVAVDNGPSRAIPERLRFKEEGLLRQTEWVHDHYVDHIVYGLLRSEWK